MNFMMDECIHDARIIKALDEIRTINLCKTFKCGYRGRTADVVLVYKGTRRFNKILVTKNIEDINEEVYPPCGHGGIIVFHEQELTPEYVVPRIQAIRIFRQSRQL